MGDRLFATTDERFDLHLCEGCGIVFLWPMPDPADLHRYYPDHYWFDPGQEGEKSAQAGLIDRYRRFLLRDHVRFVSAVIQDRRQAGRPTRVIDIGCGDGSFLQALGEPESMGMDMSPAAVRIVGERGYAAVCGSPTDHTLPHGSFGVITAFHFLEHVHPVEPILEAIRGLLAPDGDLVVQVPNRDSWQARLLGRHWSGYDVPRHLVDYSDRTLTATLERSGFSVIDKSHHSIRDNPGSLASSIAPGLHPPGRMARTGRRDGVGAALANLTYMALTLASLPFCLAESLFGHGASVMVRARPH